MLIAEHPADIFHSRPMCAAEWLATLKVRVDATCPFMMDPTFRRAGSKFLFRLTCSQRSG